MAINWPLPAYVGEPYVYNGKTWIWNGDAWQAQGVYTPGPTGLQGAQGAQGAPGESVNPEGVLASTAELPPNPALLETDRKSVV